MDQAITDRDRRKPNERLQGRSSIDVIKRNWDLQVYAFKRVRQNVMAVGFHRAAQECIPNHEPLPAVPAAKSSDCRLSNWPTRIDGARRRFPAIRAKSVAEILLLTALISWVVPGIPPETVHHADQ